MKTSSKTNPRRCFSGYSRRIQAVCAVVLTFEMTPIASRTEETPARAPETTAAEITPHDDLPTWSKLSLEQRRQLREVYSRSTKKWPKPAVETEIEWREIGMLPKVEYTKNNPNSRYKEELEKKLFFDKQLSGNSQHSCATCHDPDRGWANGHDLWKENSLWEMPHDPTTLLNVGFRKTDYIFSEQIVNTSSSLTL
jgi:hypothetical protein